MQDLEVLILLPEAAGAGGLQFETAEWTFPRELSQPLLDGVLSNPLNSTFGDYSYTAGDVSIIYSDVGKFCSIASHVRINSGNHATWRVTQHHATYRRFQVAVQAAKEAGALILAQRAQPLTLIPKGHRGWATNVDLAAQNLIIEILRQEFPEHHFLAEENKVGVFPSNGDGDSVHPIWIIDPLDGTSNYSRGLPNFAVSIALAIDTEVLLGVVYDPVHDELFTAISSEGSHCNDMPLQTSPVTQLSAAIFSLDGGRSFEQCQQTLAALGNLIHQVRTIRAIGSAALALCWIAAGLILSEAGGKICDAEGHMWDLA